MNDTICDKQRHTGTARKRLYVYEGCRLPEHGLQTVQASWDDQQAPIRCQDLYERCSTDSAKSATITIHSFILLCLVKTH
ncbi:hypothetical protein T03_1186 [Trichinella britovi]|uniref:Uncharacterized protein n=1 Tax=Trichinella britovi TaxID=45882 RepID=A0A0V1D2A9_TRIBR|nr:hypothetical protein T03_1186 [Trichinella britovi]